MIFKRNLVRTCRSLLPASTLGTRSILRINHIKCWLEWWRLPTPFITIHQCPFSWRSGSIPQYIEGRCGAVRFGPVAGNSTFHLWCTMYFPNFQPRNPDALVSITTSCMMFFWETVCIRSSEVKKMMKGGQVQWEPSVVVFFITRWTSLARYRVFPVKAGKWQPAVREPKLSSFHVEMLAVERCLWTCWYFSFGLRYFVQTCQHAILDVLKHFHHKIVMVPFIWDIDTCSIFRSINLESISPALSCTHRPHCPWLKNSVSRMIMANAKTVSTFGPLPRSAFKDQKHSKAESWYRYKHSEIGCSERIISNRNADDSAKHLHTKCSKNPESSVVYIKKKQFSMFIEFSGKKASNGYIIPYNSSITY